MVFKLTKSFWLNLTVLIAAVILFFIIFSAVNSGRRQAQAQMVRRNAAALVRGLKYFFSDNGRYPTDLEFADRNLMLHYFNSFPPIEFSGKHCEKSFSYKRINSSLFNLYFCLLKSFEGFSRGWNFIAE